MPLQGLDSVRAMIAKNKKESNEKLRIIFFKGLRDMIKPTPVDQGRARNNWFLTTGMPSGLVGRDASESGSDSMSSLDSMPKYVLNKKIYFTNNIPYIGMLEYGGYAKPGTAKTSNGFSIQAPEGWVRIGLKEMEAKVRAL
jgi:hypothetical protein